MVCFFCKVVMQISISKSLWSLVEFYLTQNCTNICPWALNHIILATLYGLVFPGHSVRNLYKHKSFFRIKFSFLFFFLSHAKCWAGWIPSWNQDCWEQYQQPQIGRYHSNGRKWREAKEPLDEGHWGEWKSWLKTQYSNN